MMMFALCVLFLFASCYAAKQLPITPGTNPNVFLTVPEIIARYGYPSETHTVRTGDGYLLGMHRIPYGKGLEPGPRPAILYMHGFRDSSADFVVHGPEKALGFKLADAGYDVWMGNFRGNAYSKGHITIPNSDPEFWNFSWDEMAEYDLPAMIDYILQMTQQKQVTYVGFSLSTAVYFAMISEKPEFNDKITMMFAMPPVAYVGNTTSIGLRTAEVLLYKTGLMKLGPPELMRHGSLLRFIATKICNIPLPLGITLSLEYLHLFTDIRSNPCLDLYFINYGFDHSQFDETVLERTISNFPQDTSLKAFIQVFQAISTGKFQKYDHGLMGNMAVYRSATPPQYDPGRVYTPLVFFQGLRDPLCDEPDLQKLLMALPRNNQPIVYRLPDTNHMDYITGKTSPGKIFTHLIDIMKEKVPVTPPCKCLFQYCV